MVVAETREKIAAVATDDSVIEGTAQSAPLARFSRLPETKFATPPEFYGEKPSPTPANPYIGVSFPTSFSAPFLSLPSHQYSTAPASAWPPQNGVAAPQFSAAPTNF